MTDNHQEILDLCNQVHNIMQDSTKKLPIPTPQEARDVRKKLSVFTYGVICELTAQIELNADEVYKNYLMMGGLNPDQAGVIVRQTRDEFTKREFGEICLENGKNAVVQWLSGDKNTQPLVEVLL